MNTGGECLALVAPDGETVVSSFSPEFPDQYRDISYGIGSGGPLSAATFIAIGAPVTYHVPGADIGSAWQSPGFDDGSWTAAHSGLGWGYSSTAVGDDIAGDGDLTSNMKGSNCSQTTSSAQPPQLRQLLGDQQGLHRGGVPPDLERRRQPGRDHPLHRGRQPAEQ